MVSAKQQVLRLVGDLPEDCSIEDVQYHLYVIEKLRRRLAMADDPDEVRLSQDDAERRMARWLTK